MSSAIRVHPSSSSEWKSLQGVDDGSGGEFGSILHRQLADPAEQEIQIKSCDRKGQQHDQGNAQDPGHRTDNDAVGYQDHDEYGGNEDEGGTCTAKESCHN